jgi:phospholipase C
VVDGSKGFLTRRRFLAGATALGAAVAFPAVRLGRAAETPIRHVIMLMRENRSFDHLFGHFPGADGLPAGAPVTRATTACLPNPPHDQAEFQHLYTGGAYRDPAATTYYTETDLPANWALARRFTLCDRYFAAALGPTFPNRVLSIAASAGSYRDNPPRIQSPLLPRPTIVDRLDAARLDWACYMANTPDAKYNPVLYYPERATDPRASHTFDEFLVAAASGTLPAVSWVIPEEPLTEHPPDDPRWGQRFAALTVQAVASGPQWAESALILNYDESGGFYDHVEPLRVDDVGYGFRVPCTVVSPYAKAGHVSHVAYDHTSVLAFVERVFGLRPLTQRDAAAKPLEDCFDFGHPTWDPIALPAELPPTSAGCHPLPDWAVDLLGQPLAPTVTPATPSRASPGVPGPASAPRSGMSESMALGLGGLGLGLLGGAAAGLTSWRGRSGDS